MAVEWEGRSLSYIRQLLGLPAQYPSAAMARSAQTLRQNPEVPPFRAVCWYDTPMGNVALSVGDGFVLSVDYRGRPGLRRFDAPVLGKYVGWSETIR